MALHGLARAFGHRQSFGALGALPHPAELPPYAACSTPEYPVYSDDGTCRSKTDPTAFEGPFCVQGRWDPATKTCKDTGTTVVHGESPAWLGPVVVLGVLGVGGLIAYSMWSNYKIVSGIAEKEGSSGVLKYEAGTAAIGIASGLASNMMGSRHHDHDYDHEERELPTLARRALGAGLPAKMARLSPCFSDHGTVQRMAFDDFVADTFELEEPDAACRVYMLDGAGQAIDYRFTTDLLLEQQDPDGSYSVHSLDGAEKAFFDEKVAPWHGLALENQARVGVPAAVTDAIMMGEGANPNARSFDGGLGLMQITDKSLKQGLSDEEVIDPETNVRLGTDFLRSLAARLGSYDPVQLASMYNCGPGDSGAKSRPSSPWGVCEYTIPSTGAQPYISKVVRAYNYALLNMPSSMPFGASAGSTLGTVAKVSGVLLLLGAAGFVGVAIANPDVLPDRVRKALPWRKP
jgi:hypothetical protein